MRNRLFLIVTLALGDAFPCLGTETLINPSPALFLQVGMHIEEYFFQAP